MTERAPRADGFPLGQAQFVPALNGLRGVAIAAVLVFHASESALSGGFLGVDLFFVLSGFLITWLLVAEHDRYGHISYRDFYARR
ncbi:MAG: acyltransferase, partial [Rhodocyclales bacterium CG17_big_fil_post_rev_8_21_14_2_50_68_7]